MSPCCASATSRKSSSGSFMVASESTEPTGPCTILDGSPLDLFIIKKDPCREMPARPIACPPPPARATRNFITAVSNHLQAGKALRRSRGRQGIDDFHPLPARVDRHHAFRSHGLPVVQIGRKLRRHRSGRHRWRPSAGQTRWSRDRPRKWFPRGRAASPQAGIGHHGRPFVEGRIEVQSEFQQVSNTVVIEVRQRPGGRRRGDLGRREIEPLPGAVTFVRQRTVPAGQRSWIHGKRRGNPRAVETGRNIFLLLGHERPTRGSCTSKPPMSKSAASNGDLRWSRAGTGLPPRS